MELGQLIEIERTGRRISDKNPCENEHSTEERVERQLHGAVLLVGRPKDGDEKIFGHDDEFVEREEQKQIGAEENAVATSDNEQQPEEKFALTLIHIPRKQHSAYSGDSRDKDHRETNAINSEMVVHRQRRDPRHADDCREVCEICYGCANKYKDAQDQTDDCCNQR